MLHDTAAHPPSRSWPLAGAYCSSPSRRLRERAGSSTTTTRSAASRRRRTRRRPGVGHRSVLRPRREPVRTARRSRPDVRARNINTIDEVPDSSWFTNRILARPLSVDEAARGPLTGNGSGAWHLDGRSGPSRPGPRPASPCATRRGRLWFVSFDAQGAIRKRRPARFSSPTRSSGRSATGRSRTTWSRCGPISWSSPRPRRSAAVRQGAADAAQRPRGGAAARRTAAPTAAIARWRPARCRASRSAASAITARVPTIRTTSVPHEHRRELRALKVFGAWTNLVDMKAGNTLDALIDRKTAAAWCVTTCRMSARRSAPAPTGRTSTTRAGNTCSRRSHAEAAVHLRLLHSAVADDAYVDNPAIGRFEGTDFDPPAWKPRVPTAAFLRARADDTFWAARRVMAFSDDLIRAIVKTGQLQRSGRPRQLLGGRADPAARQDRPRVSDRGQSGGRRRARRQRRADVRATPRSAAGVAKPPAGGYVVHWARFDNATGTATGLGTSTADESGRTQAPASLPTDPGAYLRIEIRAVQPEHPVWGTPVSAFFRRDQGWRLVGLERIP